MVIYIHGDQESTSSQKPIIIMLPGSFCSSESLKNIYSKLCEDYCIVTITYNGHHRGPRNFSTRQKEAEEICKYIVGGKIQKVKMIYGQSMGTEIGMELLKQLLQKGVQVEKTVFDGAPFIKLSKPYKQFMYFKFKTMINMFKNKTIDEVMNWKFLKKFAGNKVEVQRPMIESMIPVMPYLTKESIKNEVECCYTFDFPKMEEEMQKNMYFFYGEDEKAYKTCIKKVKKAYPYSNYRIEEGQAHLTYACEHNEEYISWIREILEN